MEAVTEATLAANYPDLVRAAVLEDPPFLSTDAQAKAAVQDEQRVAAREEEAARSA